MDFIIKLLKLKEPGITEEYDFVFVVTDKLTKYGYFISCREDMLVKELTYLFNRYMIS
jgi:hypothetical protein